MSNQASYEPDIDALFAGPFDTFIERRKALAKRLKGEGAKERAAEVGSIAKPSVSAWAVNHLWANRRADIEALFESGSALRASMKESLAGRGEPGAVKELQGGQRDDVEALVDAAREAIETAGNAANEAVIGRIRTSLTTLSTRSNWGDVSPGRLVKDVEALDMAAIATLLDQTELPVAPKPRAADAPVVARHGAREEKEHGRREALEAALRAKREAERAFETASARAKEANAKLAMEATRARTAVENREKVASRIDALASELEALRAELARTETADRAAEEKRAAAELDAGRETSMVERAKEDLVRATDAHDRLASPHGR